MSLDHQALEGMLTRLHLTAIRDQLDNLLDEAVKRQLTPPVEPGRIPQPRWYGFSSPRRTASSQHSPW